MQKVQGEHKAVPGLITVTQQPGSGSFVICSCTRLFSHYMNRLHGLRVSMDCMNRYGCGVCACVYAYMPKHLKSADVNKTQQLAGEARGGGKTSSCAHRAARPCAGHPGVISHVEGYRCVCVRVCLCVKIHR